MGLVVIRKHPHSQGSLHVPPLTRRVNLWVVRQKDLRHPTWRQCVKARTHRPIFRGFSAESAVESADSIPESSDSTTDFPIVGRLSLSNMFDILLVHPVGQRESADYCRRPTANCSSGYGPLPTRATYNRPTGIDRFPSADSRQLIPVRGTQSVVKY